MILLIGGNGSIGRRYQAILEYLEEPYIVHDFPFLVSECNWPDFDKAIIASPTNTHEHYCNLLSRMNKPFLCEKPLSKDVEASRRISEECKNGFVVNNYAFVNTSVGFPPIPATIDYDFYNTGRDGLVWDVCQLVYLAYISKAELMVIRKSYTWHFQLNHWKVPYDCIEASYMQMIRAFLTDNHGRLWNLKQGHQMTQICSDLFKRGGDCEGFLWHPGKDEFKALSKKDTSKYRA